MVSNVQKSVFVIIFSKEFLWLKKNQKTIL